MTTKQKEHRQESDSMGVLDIPNTVYWGAQTERSRMNFNIGHETMPPQVIRCFGLQKWAAAKANGVLGLVSQELVNAICHVALEVYDGKLFDHFPLKVWQTGSGTQTNMNANEVIANRASVMLGGAMGTKTPVHPNDHVNYGQSSNDSFPTVMHLAVALDVHAMLRPALQKIHGVLENHATQFKDIIKMGRTHMQDATPLTLGQEFGAYAQQIHHRIQSLDAIMPRVYELAQGGTAVGTGLNTHGDFPKHFVDFICQKTQLPFKNAPNTFEALACHDALVDLSGVLNTTAVSLMKIANDIRLMASGPRGGIGEITLPANEPGSSIMPGKVNPTQVEALTMICAQVMGNHTTVTIAGSQGHLELNVYKPVIIYNLLQSITLLAQGMTAFTDKCLAGLVPCVDRIQQYLDHSLMMVTALNPHVGYDNAARIAKKAFQENMTLKEAAHQLGLVSPQDFERWVQPQAMLHPRKDDS